MAVTPRQRYWLNMNQWNKSCINSTQKSQPIHCHECKRPHSIVKWRTCKFELYDLDGWMPFTRHSLGVLIGLNAALIPKGGEHSLFTEASKVDRRSWVALHQGGREVPQEGEISAGASYSPSPWGKHWPGRCLGDTGIWLSWRWGRRFGYLCLTYTVIPLI